MVDERLGARARRTLGLVRLVNGGAALLAPQVLATRFGVDPGRNGAALYALRLFGVRTVVIGAELLVLRGDALTRAVRTAPIVHASDTAAAVLAGATGQLPRKAAVTAAAVSAGNTALSLLAVAAQEKW